MKLLRFEVIDPKYLKYAENVAEQYFEVSGMRIEVKGRVELVTFPRNKLGVICEKYESIRQDCEKIATD